MTGVDWQPTATRERLAQRARLLSTAREFLNRRGLLEVETPLAVIAAVTDVHLASAEVRFGHDETPRYLHTSPEYAMKRLLAAGSGDIWQLCKVFRADERSAVHNPEFTMLEWYRVGFDMPALIDEVAELVQALLEVSGAPARAPQRLTYRAAFLEHVGVDPLAADRPALEAAAAPAAVPEATLRSLNRDELLDLLMALRVGPQLGRGALTFVTHYPASQAALARLDPADPRVAHRFELYADGVELANGFHELADSAEQRRRFEADRRERQRRGLVAPALDERLLAALSRGLPDCAGVALGFDRVAMLATGAAHIDEILSFPYDRA